MRLHYPQFPAALRRLAILAILVFSVTALHFQESTALAQTPPCGSGTFTSPSTCSYGTTGSADTYTVPAGVTRIHVITVGAKGATGGSGGGCGCSGAGGAGGFGDI